MKLLRRFFTYKKNDRVFGLTRELFFLTHSISTFTRTHSKEELRFLGMRVFKRDLPIRFELKNLYNLQLMQANYMECSKLSGAPENHRILYVADYLESIGGVETRLQSQFDYLSRRGVTPMLLTKKNLFVPTLGYANFHLDYDASNAEDLLIELIHKCGAQVVEFQMKSPRFMEHLNLDLLKLSVRIGGCVHGPITVDLKKLNQLDYLLVSSEYISRDYPGSAILKNWVVDQKTILKADPSSAKALLISRIDTEKFPNIKNFIRVCQQNQLDFEIAGSADHEHSDQKIKDFLLSLNVDEKSLIGPVRTLDYLKEHGSEYLFIAGVGQVPLEAASFGLPAMVVPHVDDPALSTVLTHESFKFLRPWNMTIKDKCPKDKCLGNLKAFFEDRKKGDFSRYDLRSEVLAECGIDKAMRNYLKLVF